MRTGFCWKGCFGGGYLCGRVDKEGEFSGDDLAYIYPGFDMALRGRFDKELLVEARLCRVEGFRDGRTDGQGQTIKKAAALNHNNI